MTKETELELAGPGGRRLACLHLPGTGPGVLFCAGFNSDMMGLKAQALAGWCAARGQQFTRFDYSGHGDSSGEFAEGTIGAWFEDTLAVLDSVTRGPQVLVGSSMGGWLSLLTALARPTRVVGLLGIAPAPDFTARLYRDRLSDAQREQLARQGYCQLPSEYGDEPYTISRTLIEEAQQHFLLEREIDLDIPVLLLQGQRDEAVPWTLALDLMAKIRSPEVEVQLVKNGDHRLSEPEDLERMFGALQVLLGRASN
ncbi:alpha/beta hydrolase [Parahaliea maris]|uniref:Palmitoyl-protein thioesterase ABHD10, mitochondrial n=1 Tax=Parahaliea maris TaxID=2716870 RepID=A0A5C9A5J7_9GAMM|nr:alpha/beta hydrolase [Parahaliea maris]TXS96068.1 alpha/beta hydrolase [Parahaliea maris]